jgi:hypothetical protein
MLLILLLTLPLSSIAIEFNILVANQLHPTHPEPRDYHSLALCQPESGFDSLFDSLLEIKKFRPLYHFSLMGSAIIHHHLKKIRVMNCSALHLCKKACPTQSGSDTKSSSISPTNAFTTKSGESKTTNS